MPKKKALYDYHARGPQELSFKKDDHLTILDSSEADWLRAENREGQLGYIPAQFVANEECLDAFEWFKDGDQQTACELILSDNKYPSGTFFVSRSVSLTYFTLVVKCNDQLVHYEIYVKNLEYFIFQEESTFENLKELVTHYRISAGGLCTKLTQACPSEIPVLRNLFWSKDQDQWKISCDTLKFGPILGEGSFGKVYKGRYCGAQDVAIKTLKAGSMSEKDFLEEASIMKDIFHRNIVQFYAICSDSPKGQLIITEYMCKGSLLKYVRTLKENYRSRKIILYMARQVAAGMAYLERNGYIHRDLAARNVLVGNHYTVKIADFGLAKLLFGEEYKASEGSIWPVRWTAPEAALHKEFSIKSDVWSFGILLFELFTYGQRPYSGFNDEEVLRKLKEGYRLPKPINCDKNLHQTMLKCWRKDPKKRPSFNDLRVHLSRIVIDKPDYTLELLAGLAGLTGFIAGIATLFMTRTK